MTRVAFIGLGNMGLGMAQRLLQAGHDLRVFNRTRSKAAALERAGARVYPTPRDACTGAEAIIAMTADDASSQSVWLGPHGVLSAQITPRALAIECSTSRMRGSWNSPAKRGSATFVISMLPLPGSQKTRQRGH